MAWSYRQDRADEVYGSGVGPHEVPAGAGTEYLVDGAISPGAGIAVLTKGTAGAYTLAAPTENGEALVITSATAAAHVVTATGLLQDGVTGGAKNTLTFAAFVGATATLRGFAGKWNTESLKAVTVA